MKYQIIIDKPAFKFLQKQPQEQRERILRSIYELPSEGDIKAMSGREGLYRLRVGSYRIIYTVEENILTVRVLTIGNRGDVYKK